MIPGLHDMQRANEHILLISSSPLVPHTFTHPVMTPPPSSFRTYPIEPPPSTSAVRRFIVPAGSQRAAPSHEFPDLTSALLHPLRSPRALSILSTPQAWRESSASSINLEQRVCGGDAIRDRRRSLPRNGTRLGVLLYSTHRPTLRVGAGACASERD